VDRPSELHRPAHDGRPGADWSVGRYETTATQLLPAAGVVVDAAGLVAGERVLDLGCGTGNAALLAADRGADVIGVDPAGRLLDVARARAASEGRHATFQLGDAASLPTGDATIDVVLSAFGVIFAPDASAAAAELARVLTPSGRVALSAWVPSGALFEMNSAATEAVRQAIAAPAPPPPFPWHDADSVTGLLAPHGFQVEVAEHELRFTAASPEAFLDSESQNHPVAVAGLRILEQLGQADTVSARLLQILTDGNEDSEAFSVTSHYRVVTARRPES
jgi:SAM-dependent methyltransferase